MKHKVIKQTKFEMSQGLDEKQLAGLVNTTRLPLISLSQAYLPQGSTKFTHNKLLILLSCKLPKSN